MNAIGFYEYTNFVRLNIPMGGSLFKCYPGPFSSVSYILGRVAVLLCK